MMNRKNNLAQAPAGPDRQRETAGRRVCRPCDTTIPSLSITASIAADQILAHPALGPCIHQQAHALVMTHRASPRMASPFATQQRWLMSQAALAQYFRNEAEQPGSGVLAERVIDIARYHGLASRNTAGAFLREMLKYDLVRHVKASEGRRHRPFEPSQGTLAMLQHWLAIHLSTLDGLDGGQRFPTLQARPDLLAAMQPVIADGLLASRTVREPDGTFSLFTWINDGGIVMDRLIAGCQDAGFEDAGCEDRATGRARIPTDVMSISAMSQRLNLSRTQLSRTFGAAEAIGSLGWSGLRGRSALWVSAGFRREYHVAQAVKLAIIDAAYAACSVSARDARTPIAVATRQ